MYTLSVARDFVARHYLTVPVPGPEGDPHGHDYRLEVRLSGPTLDEFGYLVDIDEVDGCLENLVERYRGALLNDLPEFEGRNPSVERFAAHLGDRLADRLEAELPSGLVVRLWEDEDAWASYERAL